MANQNVLIFALFYTHLLEGHQHQLWARTVSPQKPCIVSHTPWYLLLIVTEGGGNNVQNLAFKGVCFRKGATYKLPKTSLLTAFVSTKFGPCNSED